MFRDHRVLMQMCGNNFMVLKVAPPLVIETEQIEKFVKSIREVVHMAHHSSDFWTEAIGLARRAANV
jgi:ornithine--oxo-acid transaminase